METWFPTVPQIITSLSAAVAAVAGVIVTNGGKMKALSQQVERLAAKIDKVYMDVLRLSFHDEHASVEERMDSGHEFVELGGNGSTRADYEVLVEEYKERLSLHNRGKGDLK
jgi:outer membrane murein-binding lipoprotein Lpp